MRHIQKLGHNSCAGNLDQHNVIKADSVERIQESQLSLNLVSFNHALKNIPDSQRLTPAGQVICYGEYSTEVV
jgi:hypothetical protein